MADDGEPAGDTGGGSGAAAGQLTGLTSFDAASFFAQQQRVQEEQRAAQGALLPGSCLVCSWQLVAAVGLATERARSSTLSPLLFRSSARVAGAQLQAVADMLLPSSSDSEGSSSDEAAAGAAGERRGRASPGGTTTQQQQRRRRRSRSRSSSGGGRRSKKRRKESKKERRREGESREERRRRKDKEQRRQQWEGERERQVRLERQTGAAQRAPQVKAWAAGDAALGRDTFYFDTR